MLTVQRFFAMVVKVDYLTRYLCAVNVANVGIEGGDFTMQVFAGDAVADYQC